MNNQNNQNNQNRNKQKNRNQNEKQQNNLFQFEMGNELGADIEKDKAKFKNEYCKDRQNNNFNTKKNQFK